MITQFTDMTDSPRFELIELESFKNRPYRYDAVYLALTPFEQLILDVWDELEVHTGIVVHENTRKIMATSNLAALPTARRIQTMTNPQLVAAIRRLSRDQVVFKLKNAGKEPAFAHILRAALTEAEKRKLTIHHPELIDERNNDAAPESS